MFLRRLALILFLYCFGVYASINDYIYPYKAASYSNYGTAGIINMPSARMQNAGTIAFSWGDYQPYIRGDIIAYPFSWLEASYYYSDVNNALYSNVPDFSGNQTYKDKGFDFKFLIIQEMNYMPAIAIGFRDAAGTGLFGAEYIVASKIFNNFDLSLGLGWGTLSRNSIKNPFEIFSDKFKDRAGLDNDTQGGEFNFGRYFSGAAGYFFGIEYRVPNVRGLRLKLELDGTDYTKEGFPTRESSEFSFKDVRKSSSKFNAGIVYPLNENFFLKLGYIKGNSINFGFSAQINLGKKEPLFKKNDKIANVPNSEVYRRINSRDKTFLYRSSLMQLNNNKIYMQSASLEGDTYIVNFAQATHTSWMRANGRALEILDQIAPDSVKKFKLVNSNANFGTYQLTAYRSSFNQAKIAGSPTILKRSSDLAPISLKDTRFDYNPKADIPKAFWTLGPNIRSQIGGPDGFFFGDLRLEGRAEVKLTQSLSIVASGSAGIYNNFDSLKLASDSILPHVRTDVVKYLKESENFAINRIQANYFYEINKELYSKLSFGILEEMFSGYGGEILYRPFYKNYAIGFEAWQVKQRDFNMLFKHQDYSTLTGHVNLYLQEPRSRVLLTIRGGRFLAKDSGINFDFSRRFKSGLRIGAYFSLTDISKAEFGEGSFDKGFYFHIPLEAFTTSYQKSLTGWGLRPLTRDGAAFLNHVHSLYGITDQAERLSHSYNWDDIFE